MVEEYLGKGEKLDTVFMDLEKAETYDRVDREALWNVLKIYDVRTINGRN